MPLLFLFFGLAMPRVAIVLLWLFTNWFTGVFTSVGLFVLGIAVLPISTLWFSLVMRAFGGQWSVLAVLGMAAALFIDASASALVYARSRTA